MRYTVSIWLATDVFPQECLAHGEAVRAEMISKKIELIAKRWQ